MTPIQPAVPKLMATGICLALLAILFGFVLGGVFGAAESVVKKHLADTGTAALQSVYQGDVAAKDAVVKKSWVYLKRAHLHGGAIGAAALATILALVFVCPGGVVARLSALALGAGALIYALFWLFAGLKAPAVGGTGAAKEALSFLAVPGAGLCLLGLIGALISIVKNSFFPARHI